MGKAIFFISFFITFFITVALTTIIFDRVVWHKGVCRKCGGQMSRKGFSLTSDGSSLYSCENSYCDNDIWLQWNPPKG